MKLDFFKNVVADTLEQVNKTLTIKIEEYVRHGNIMHNFDKGAEMTNQTREKVLYGFVLKHLISISDMRDDIEEGILPTEEKVEEKFNDAINYFILEKASILERIKNKQI